MKLKEKLARDWSEQNLLPDWTPTGRLNKSMPAFIAGFEKAREMATRIVHEYSYYGENEQVVVTEGRGIFFKVQYLGEEEVEE